MNIRSTKLQTLFICSIFTPVHIASMQQLTVKSNYKESHSTPLKSSNNNENIKAYGLIAEGLDEDTFDDKLILSDEDENKNYKPEFGMYEDGELILSSKSPAYHVLPVLLNNEIQKQQALKQQNTIQEYMQPTKKQTQQLTVINNYKNSHISLKTKGSLMGEYFLPNETKTICTPINKDNQLRLILSCADIEKNESLTIPATTTQIIIEQDQDRLKITYQ